MNKDFYTLEINETVSTFLDSLSDDELRSIINDGDQESRLDDLVQKCPIVSVSCFFLKSINLLCVCSVRLRSAFLGSLSQVRVF